MSTTLARQSSNGFWNALAAAAYASRRLICAGADVSHVKTPDGAAVKPIGVLVDGCDAANVPVDFELLGKGETKIINIAGTCSKGDRLVCTTDSRGQCRTLPTAPGTYYVIGDALQDGVDGQDLEVKDCEPYLVVVQATLAALTGTLTGTVDGALVDIAAAGGACAGSTTPSASNVDTAIATAVAPIVSGTNEQIKELFTRLNAIRTALIAGGFIKAALWFLVGAVLMVVMYATVKSGTTVADLAAGGAAATAAVLPMALPPRFRRPGKRFPLQRRFPGKVVWLANEDKPATAADPNLVAANSIQILDHRGNVIPIAGRDGAVIRLGNASTALAATPVERLTTFATGFPRDDIESFSSFMFPYVPAGLKYDYLKNPETNAFAIVDDDTIGINGLPKVIRPDGKTVGTGQLKWRGLETTLTESEALAAAANPGWSVAMEEEDRIALITDATRRGRFARCLALAVTASGAATGKTWNDAADPVSDLRAEVNIIALLCGGKQNVAVMFGASAFEILFNHKTLKGGTYYAQIPTDEARVAALLGIQASNVMINYLQVNSAAAGKTAVRAMALTTNEIWIFARFPNPGRRDAGFAKTFAMQKGAGWYEVYTYQTHPKVTMYGLDYYEDPIVTNSAAVKRLSVTSS